MVDVITSTGFSCSQTRLSYRLHYLYRDHCEELQYYCLRCSSTLLGFSACESNDGIDIHILSSYGRHRIVGPSSRDSPRRLRLCSTHGRPSTSVNCIPSTSERFNCSQVSTRWEQYSSLLIVSLPCIFTPKVFWILRSGRCSFAFRNVAKIIHPTLLS